MKHRARFKSVDQLSHHCCSKLEEKAKEYAGVEVIVETSEVIYAPGFCVFCNSPLNNSGKCYRILGSPFGPYNLAYIETMDIDEAPYVS